MPELAKATGYDLHPQVFVPISPSSYFNRQLPTPPTVKLDKLAGAQSFAAMMKVLGDLPGHLQGEYAQGKKRGLQNQLQARYLQAVNSGDKDGLAGFQIDANGNLLYNPGAAVDALYKKSEINLNAAKLERLKNGPLGGLPSFPGTGGGGSTIGGSRTGGPRVEPDLPTLGDTGLPTPNTSGDPGLDPAPPDAGLTPAPAAPALRATNPSLRPATPPVAAPATPATSSNDTGASSPYAMSDASQDGDAGNASDAQLAAFIAPASTADSPAGPVTVQTAPPIAAVQPGQQGQQASAAPPTGGDGADGTPSPTPAPTGEVAGSGAASVDPQTQQLIANAASIIGPQLGGLDLSSLSAAGNGSPVASANVAPVTRAAASAAPAAAPASLAPPSPNMPSAADANGEGPAGIMGPDGKPLNGIFNMGDGSAAYFMNGVRAKIGIPDMMTGELKWIDPPKRSQAFPTFEAASAYAKAHGFRPSSISQGSDGWTFGPSVSDDLAGYKSGTPEAELLKHNINPKGMTPEQIETAFSRLQDPIGRETRKDLQMLKIGDVDPVTKMKLSETEAQALIQDQIEKTGKLPPSISSGWRDVAREYKGKDFESAMQKATGYNNFNAAYQTTLAQNNGINNIALLDNFTKANSGGTVVRQEAANMVAHAQGLLSKFRDSNGNLDLGYLKDHANMGAFLTPQQIQQMKQVMDEEMKGQADIFNKAIYVPAVSDAIGRGVPEAYALKNLVNPYVVVGIGQTPATPAPAMSAQDQQALTWLQANPNDPRAPKVKATLQAKGINVN